MTTSRWHASFAAALLAACAPSLIPGTAIPDTKDHRAVLDVLARYKNAFEARDAAGIAALASVRYLDPRDSISRTTLEQNLDEEFGRVKETRLDLKPNRIEVTRDHATVDYYYSADYLLDLPGADWRHEADDKRMELERTGDGWKVVSGF